MRKARRTIAHTLAFAAVALAGMGCAFGEIRWDDPMGHLYALEERQQYYSQLVRFGDYHTALRFVDPELRDDFQKRFDMTIRFTDMESGPVEIDESHQNSTVTVRYLGYEQHDMVENKYVEKQEWFRVPPMNDWYVRPYFEGLEQAPPPRDVAAAKPSVEDHAKNADMGTAP